MTETGESVGAVSPFRFLGRSLFVDVALPWLTVRILEAHGVPTVWALAVAALFPGASTLLSWVYGRRVEAIGIAVFVTILLGIAMALISDEVRFGLLKAAPAFGLFGLACLASSSPAISRPQAIRRGPPNGTRAWKLRAFAMPCASSPRSGAWSACWKRCWASRPRSCSRCTPRSWRSRRWASPAWSGCWFGPRLTPEPDRRGPGRPRLLHPERRHSNQRERVASVRARPPHWARL